VKILRNLLITCAPLLAILIGCGSSHSKSYISNNSNNVTITDWQFVWTSSYDNVSRPDQILIYGPPASYGPGPFPVMIFHRGRGFDFSDYTEVLSGIAQNGIMCVSIDDLLSFASRTDPGITNPTYDDVSPAAGMESASYAEQEALTQVLTLNETPNSAIYRQVNASYVFFAGHSRGGGAVEYLQSRHVPAQGFIYYMAFDLKTELNITLPVFSPVPSICFAATLDGNLGVTSTSAVINNMIGPTQLITIYGGNHDYIGDNNSIGESATISRQQEHNIIISNTINFITRYDP
jgi:hypothetical protein